ncbi:MAG: hypothetical protein HRT77_12065, partial [Halioglobus sp.]|nr:hypothetical protein [Halioglobus sp.]
VVSETETFLKSAFLLQAQMDYPQRGYWLKLEGILSPYKTRISTAWLNADYILYIPEWSRFRFASALTAFLNNTPDEFEDLFTLVDSYPLPGGWSAKLLRRTRDVTMAEAVNIVDSINLPEKMSQRLRERVIGNLYPNGFSNGPIINHGDADESVK